MKIKYPIKQLLPYITFRLNEIIKNKLFNIYASISAFWWDVKIGKDCSFYGKTYFFKHYDNTEIIIGNRCTFRSSFSSNTIGLKQKCYLSTSKGARIIIGDNCGFSGTVIAACQLIKIGNNVLCGANVTITDNDRHPLNSKERISGLAGKCAPVNIGDEVFIGMNTIVLKGVTIGKGSVIAANSVVTKNIPDNVIAGGNPAKIISTINQL
jgi:acetyltransferase-like isoleucine patch superfamily enzyme